MQILARHLDRHQAVPLHRALQSNPVVALTGPRRAGKATLARREFPGLRYVNLDDPADRLRARQGPAAFLASLRHQAIIDHVHRAPELLAALRAGLTERTEVQSADGPSRAGRTQAGKHGEIEAPELATLRQGTTSLLLLAPVRLDLPVELHLYPPSLAEREHRPPTSLGSLARYPPAPGRAPAQKLDLATGPRDEETLLRDAATLVGLHDPDRFLEFVHTAAAASGTIVDQSQWARACGVTHTTIARWRETLERTFHIIQPRAFGEPFGRRLVRRRKLFFLDPSWVAEAARFESWGVAEIVKTFAHTAQPVEVTHWATATGQQTGFIAETVVGPVSFSFTRLPIAPPALVTAAAKWRTLADHHAACIFVDGRQADVQRGVAIHPWWRL